MNTWHLLSTTPLSHLLRGRLSGSLDWRAGVAASGLPEPQRAVIVAVVERTRLWRGEQAGVAEELVAHFHDANEADAEGMPTEVGTPGGGTPESRFGDPMVAAKLIRRAKRRCRPLWWHGLMWLRWSPLVLLAIYGLLWMNYFVGSPRVSVDYLAILNEKPASVAEEDRAWPLYRESMLMLGMGNDAPAGSRPEVTLRPGDEGWEDFAQYLRHHQAAIALARDAAAKEGMGYVALRGAYHAEDVPLFGEFNAEMFPDMTPEMRETLMHVLLPQISTARQIGNILAADAALAADEGRLDRAVADITATLRLGRHVAETPPLISGVVGVSGYLVGYAGVGDLLLDHADALSREQMIQLAHALAEADAEELITFESERDMFLDLIQRMYTDDGHGDGRLTNEGVRLMRGLEPMITLSDDPATPPAFREPKWLRASRDHLEAPVAVLFFASREQMRDKLDELLARAEREVHTPLWEQRGPSVDDTLDAMSQDWLERRRYRLLVQMMPATSAAARTVARADSRRDGLLVAIAFEIFRREHGDYPDPAGGAEQLVPRYLPTLPRDPANGTPLLFTLREGKPVVYGRGSDGGDDGGVPPRKSSGEPDAWAAFGPPQEGRVAADGDWVVFPLPNR